MINAIEQAFKQLGAFMTGVSKQVFLLAVSLVKMNWSTRHCLRISDENADNNHFYAVHIHQNVKQDALLNTANSSSSN